MSDLIPISAKMVGDTGYRKMYLARHVEKRIAAFEARVAELERGIWAHHEHYMNGTLDDSNKSDNELYRLVREQIVSASESAS